MNKSTRHTPEFKEKLSSDIGELTRYLESKSGFQIRLSVILDQEAGYVYSAKISQDNFSCYAKWILYCTGKQKIKNELLLNVKHFDFRYKERVSTPKKATKRVGSSSMHIDCCCCGNGSRIPTEIHSNIHSPLWINRGGCVLMCHTCATQQFSKILRERDVFYAFWWICAAYDRRFNIDLIRKIKDLPLSPYELCQTYFRRLNLSKRKSDGYLFVDSDRFSLKRID
jgi:hypothetical protein